MIMYPNSGVLWGAGLMQTALANSEVHLFQAGMGITLNPGLTLAELAAAECDFTGYLAVSVAAWLDPLLNPVGGAGIDSGVAQFAAAAPYTIGNVVGGGWIETAGGVLICAWDYDPGRSVGAAGQGVGIDLVLIFG